MYSIVLILSSNVTDKRAGTPLSEMEEYRVEVCIVLRQLERLDKDKFTEDERADAEEVN